MIELLFQNRGTHKLALEVVLSYFQEDRWINNRMKIVWCTSDVDILSGKISKLNAIDTHVNYLIRTL